MQPDYRRSDHRLGVRGQRHRAAAHREGLPRRRARGRPPLRRRGVRQDLLEPAQVPLGAASWACYGIQRIHLLRNVMILAGAGVGGGSLNYANTLYVPPDPFFNDPQWKHITDWRAELMPHYEQAQRMLGVVQNPTFTDADQIMKEVADDMGVGDTFVPTPVGVFFGPDGTKTPGKTVPDPYFGGAGPARTGCIECGSCMTGCRYGAKNTLRQELPRPRGIRWGASTSDDHGDRASSSAPTGCGRSAPHAPAAAAPQATHVHRHAPGARRRHVRHPEAAVQDARQRQRCRSCPTSSACSPAPTPSRSSARGGSRCATTSTSPTAWRSRRRSTPTSDTHVEPVRYGKGSNAMGLLQTLMTDGAGPAAPTSRAGGSCWTRRARTRRRCCGCSTRGTGASAP